MLAQKSKYLSINGTIIVPGNEKLERDCLNRQSLSHLVMLLNAIRYTTV